MRQPHTKLFFLLLFIAACLSGQAQYITAGPLVGGVTDHSARIYIQTDSLRAFQLEVSSDSLFGTFTTYTDSTRALLYNVVIVDLAGLTPATTYFYRYQFGPQFDIKAGRFKTFPLEGQKTPLRIAVGSCNYTPNAQLFQHISDFDPSMLIHLGDWNWPPAQFGNDMMLYPDRRAASFASRYNDSSMSHQIMPHIPVEYIYDDDFSWNDGEGWTYPTFSVSIDTAGLAHTQLSTVQMPPGIREGAIKAYFDHFPGYTGADTSAGIYHSIKIGNVEILMLDLRNNRDPRHEAFHYDSTSGLWSYAPAPGHTMMGDKQRSWLIDRLTHPTTDWQIIGSSIIFNKNYDTLLNIGIRLQQVAINLNGSQQSGAVLASQMSYDWAGYPYDHDTILAMKNSGAIHDVVVISGDSHSNMVDDGTNAGLPEMQASGMSAGDEGTFNHYVDQYAPYLGYPSVRHILWDGGGNGIDNTDYLNGYGTIEVFGADSLRLCVYDETNYNMGCKTILHSGLSTAVQSVDARPSLRIYPNPGSSMLQIECGASDYKVVMYDVLGANICTKENLNGTVFIPTAAFASGIKLVQVFDSYGHLIDSKKWVKL